MHSVDNKSESLLVVLDLFADWDCISITTHVRRLEYLCAFHLLLNRKSITPSMPTTPNYTLNWRMRSALQTCFSLLYTWCVTNGLPVSLNAEKLEAISFSSRQNSTSISQHTDVNLAGSKIAKMLWCHTRQFIVSRQPHLQYLSEIEFSHQGSSSHQCLTEDVCCQCIGLLQLILLWSFQNQHQQTTTYPGHYCSCRYR